MPEATTPTPASGEPSTDATPGNWESRYAGLQKVLGKRDTELTTAKAELDQLRAEREQAAAELDTYRQRAVDESEEEQARQQFDNLKARFEPTPAPVGNNPRRDLNDWTSPDREASYGNRERTGAGTGWPT